MCAPAGFGKTSLLAEWVASTGGADVAWVSVDSMDNDADRFFFAILSAVRDCWPVPAGSGLHRLTPRPADPVGVLAEFVDAVSDVPARVCVVLDDLHEITSPASWHRLETLIRYQPRNLRLALSTRCDPPLPLARLRMQGELTELRAHDLRFATEEADTLLRQAGVALSTGQLARLVEQTEGWAAGLRLAARSLRDLPDRDGFVGDFAENEQSVADYLVSEVLGTLSEETIDVLRVVSICAEVTPGLATTLSGRADAGAILAKLEQENSLVTRVGKDQRWYRVHPVLRSFLRADLRRHRPDLVDDLHATAARWLAEEEQRLPQALEHAGCCHDSAALTWLLRRYGILLVLRGNEAAVRRALDIIGTGDVAGDPQLSLLSGLVHLQAGRLADAARELGRSYVTAQAEETGDIGELAMLCRLARSTYALTTGGDVDSELGPPGPVATPELEVWAWLDRGWAAVRDGTMGRARAALRTAESMAQDQGLDHVRLHALAARTVAAWLDGDYVGMARACSECSAFADARGWHASPALALNRLADAFLRILGNEPCAARQSVRAAGESDLTQGSPALTYLVSVVDGLCAFDAGGRAEGLRRLRQARATLGATSTAPAVASVGAIAESQAALALGDSGGAREVVDWLHERAGPTAEAALIQAWIVVAHGALGAAGQALARVDVAPSLLPPVTRVEAQLLAATVASRAGRRAAALESLQHALHIAAPARVVRPFVQAEPSIGRLLNGHAGRFGGAEAFSDEVRRAMFVGERESGGESLTTREYDVLGHLASPVSFDEVAESLSVSVNTVKTHVRAIYAKLGVTSRRAAVSAARARGLT